MRFKAPWMWILLFCCFLASYVPASAQGSSTWKVTRDQAVMTFPVQIDFLLTLRNAGSVEQITLVYRANGATCHAVNARQKVEVKQGDEIAVNWKWDLQKAGSLPPGAEVTWNWEIQEKDGTIQQTDEKTMAVEDYHHVWQRIEKERFSLYWDEGGEAFGGALAAIVDKSLDRLKDEIGVEPGTVVRVMVYASADDVKAATLHTPDWIGGIAFSEYGSVLMEIPPGELAWAEQVIPHELTHLVIDRRITNCVGYSLPTWLNEGLAMYLEGDASPDEIADLKKAIEKEQLDPLISLTAGFSANGDQARLAYSQSRQVVTFLLAQFGKDKLDDLLDLIPAGVPIDTALSQVYGYDTAVLDLAWRADLGFGTMPVPSQSTPTPVKKRTSVPTVALWTSAVKAPIPSQTASSALTADPSQELQSTSTQMPIPTPTQTSTAGGELTRKIGPFLCLGIGIVAVIAIGAAAAGIVILQRLQNAKGEQGNE